MYFSIVPTLTRGAFALYYGGPEIVPQLSSKLGSLLTPGFILLSFVIQVVFIVYLKVQARLIESRNTNIELNKSRKNFDD